VVVDVLTMLQFIYTQFSGVTRKFHMASIAHGVHLLRMVGYDRQVSITVVVLAFSATFSLVKVFSKLSLSFNSKQEV